MATEQIIFLLILAAALVMFISGKLRIDLVAMLVLMALALTGILDGRQALSGFSSEPAIIVASVFVLSGGLAATGLTDRLGAWIGLAAGGSEWRMIAVVMPAVAVLSAFSPHLVVPAMSLAVHRPLGEDDYFAWAGGPARVPEVRDPPPGVRPPRASLPEDPGGPVLAPPENWWSGGPGGRAGSGSRPSTR